MKPFRRSDVRITAVLWFLKEPKKFFAEEIDELVCQWDNFLIAHWGQFNPLKPSGYYMYHVL
jgi:acyl carrier protein phosphodiesterase